MSDEEIIAAFKAEGRFDWWNWYGDGFPKFKSLLKEQGGELNSYTIREGKCIDCTKRIAVSSIWVSIPGRNDITLIDRFKDRCDCD